jgi:hypothetical protein
MWYLIEAVIILALCGGAFVWTASRRKAELNAFVDRVAEVDATAHRVVTDVAARVGLKLLGATRRPRDRDGLTRRMRDGTF